MSSVGLGFLAYSAGLFLASPLLLSLAHSRTLESLPASVILSTEIVGEVLLEGSPPVADIQTPALLPPSLLPSPVLAATILVSPTGVDAPDRGIGGRPLRTVSQALQRARPGDVIEVQAGEYQEHIVTTTAGQAQQPITLRAQGRVVFKGDQKHGRLMEVRHDYYDISGFEFTNADILLWLEGARYAKITNNYFHEAQGECVRFKYHSTHNLFAHNRVEFCGREDFGGGGDGKNGEGLYLGTAPEQLDRNPTPETDQTNANTIRANTFNTRGNECVDIKEGASENVVEFNDCTGQRDSESGGFDARGSGNIFRYNTSYGNLGAGIRFGGDEESDGINNQAYGNELYQNENVAIKVMRLPQGLICGNKVSANESGFSNNKSIQNPACPFPLSPPGRPS